MAIKNEVDIGAVVAAVEGPEQKLEASRAAKFDNGNDTSNKPALPEGSRPGCRPVFLQRRFRGRLSHDTSRSQEWLNRRLEGIRPTDFHPEGVAIYTTRRLRCPAGFEQVWHPISNLHIKGELLPEEEPDLVQIPVVLVFANLLDEEQMRGALGLSSAMTVLGNSCPPIILVPHSLPPTEYQSLGLEDLTFKAAVGAIRDGIDDVVYGEPESFELAFEVQNRVLLQARSASNLNVQLEKQQQFVQRSSFLRNAMRDILWDYLRVRMNTGIPQVDDTISPGEPKRLGNYSVGMKLGEGSFGKVYRLEHLGGGNVASGEVLKIVPKGSVTSFDGMLALKHQVDVMSLLSSKWSHLHIIKLYEVYHSETHVLMRMQDGGHMDLYKRLRAREQKQWPVTVPKAKNVMKQLMDAVCHMHLGPMVVHRDLKPENIIISETKTDVKIYVSDFDTARIIPERRYCRGICGTFPFFAPEVVLRDKYDPFSADIWSTAMVFLELVCCLGVLRKALSFAAVDKNNDRAQRMQKERDMTEKIYECFQNVDAAHALLDWYVRPELESLKGTMRVLSDGMLNVDSRQRWTEEKVKEAVENLKVNGCLNEPSSPKESSLVVQA